MSDNLAFDPTRHLTKVSGRDYLEVKWRLVWLRDTYPLAQIETEMVQHQNQLAVFRAKITLPPQPYDVTIDGTGEISTAWFSASATGWGSEGSDDFGDYLEKAETKAIGRALAALGFGTQFCPDYDFGADRQRVVDSPVDIRSGRQGPSATQEATPRQIKYLYAAAREAGLSNEELEERCEDSFGHGIADLNRRDISALIEQLQAGRPVSPIASAPAHAAPAPRLPQQAQTPQPAPQRASRSGWQPTDRQVNFVDRLYREANLTTAELRADACFSAVGKPFADLENNDELNRLIEWLKAHHDAEWAYSDSGMLVARTPEPDPPPAPEPDDAGVPF